MALQHHRVFPVERKGDILIVVPSGDAVGFREADLEHELKAILEELQSRTAPKLVIDFSSDVYFGSVVIGAVTQMARTATQRGGKAVLCNASHDMRQMLSVLKLDTLWPILPTRRQALKAVKQPA